MEWSTVSQYIWKHFVQDSLGFAVVTNSFKISMPYINQCLFLAYAACLMCWRQALLFSVSAQTDGESFLMYMLPTAPEQGKDMEINPTVVLKAQKQCTVLPFTFFG